MKFTREPRCATKCMHRHYRQTHFANYFEMTREPPRSIFRFQTLSRVYAVSFISRINFKVRIYWIFLK